MRGKDCTGLVFNAGNGITPAYAGKRKEFFALWHLMMGSPPPMRGKGFKSSVDAGKYRITPAYAGKRKSRIVLCKKVRDHPRLCGEKILKKDGHEREIGSPPPMRGKVEKLRHVIAS